MVPVNALATQILRGPAAVERLRDRAFRAAAERLYAACPWATSGQRPEFLRICMETYGGEFEPWLSVAVLEDGELAGLLPLLRTPRGLEYAGFLDCDYHGWLALPETSDAFIASGLTGLQEQSGAPIVLPHLPPGTPLDWTRSARRLRPYLQEHRDQRLVAQFEDADALRAWVRRQRRLRESWSRFARSGRVGFRRVRDLDEVDALLERFAAMYDVRKGSAYGLTPFRDDPRKLGFLRAQARVPGLLHVTALERDGELVAAHVGTAGTREFALSGFAHSEFASDYSPGLMHLFQLVQWAVRDEGFRVVDLSPGAEPFKLRLATGALPVHGFTLHPTRIAAGAGRASADVHRTARRGLALLDEQARASPEGWSARLRGLMQQVRRRRAGHARPVALEPSARTEIVAPPAWEGRFGAWRRNDIGDLCRFVGARDAYVELLREFASACRARAELYTDARGGRLRVAAVLVAASRLSQAGAPDGAELLYVACVDATSPLRHAARSVVRLAGALPADVRARLHVVSGPRVSAELPALVRAEAERRIRRRFGRGSRAATRLPRASTGATPWSELTNALTPLA